MFCWFNAYPDSRGSLQGEINEARRKSHWSHRTSTLGLVQNFNLACDWPFVKICQTGLGNKQANYSFYSYN